MERIKEKNIKSITDGALCTACGACAAVCAKNAVSMERTPSGFLRAKLDETLCASCSRCVEVCPSAGVDTPIPSDNVIGCYAACATKYDVRRNGQSGGAVTAMLCYLINAGKIDGATVNKMNLDTLLPEVIFATSEEELLSAAGSVYSQSAVLESALDAKLAAKTTAAVVLGCQAEALASVRQKLPNVKTPDYVIGLVCVGQDSPLMLDKMIENASCDRSDVVYARYKSKRGCGWPGRFTCTTAGGRVATLPINDRRALVQHYKCARCEACYDKFNYFADVTAGDPWGVMSKQSPEGYTVLITRTKKGEELVREATQAGYIDIEPIDAAEVYAGQKINDAYFTHLAAVRAAYAKRGYMYPYSDESAKAAFRGSDARSFETEEKETGYLRRFYFAKSASCAHAMAARRAKRERRKSVMRKLRSLFR